MKMFCMIMAGISTVSALAAAWLYSFVLPKGYETGDFAGIVLAPFILAIFFTVVPFVTVESKKGDDKNEL